MNAYESSLNHMLTKHKTELKQMQERFMNRVQNDIDFSDFEKRAIADLTLMADIKSKIEALELSLILLKSCKKDGAK